MPRRKSKPVQEVIDAQAAGEAVVADIEANPQAYADAIENRPDATEFDPAKLEALPRPQTERNERELPESMQEARQEDGQHGGHAHRLRHTRTVSVGQDKIHVVDEGRFIGIEIEMGDESRPSAAVTAILKAAGLTYRPGPDGKPWTERTSRDPEHAAAQRYHNEGTHAEVVQQHRTDRGEAAER